MIVAGNLAQEKAGYLYGLPAEPAYNLYGVGFDESRALEMKLTLDPSYRMSFLQPLRVVLDLSGMGIVRKPVVVFWRAPSLQQLSQGVALSSIGLPAGGVGNSQPCLTLCLRRAVGLQ